MSELAIRNRQRRFVLDLPSFRHIAEMFLARQLENRPYEISVFLVGSKEMARINQEHLQHSGSTDVITFPYSEPAGNGPLVGDLFICLEDAVQHAEVFGTSWQEEWVRYFVHGVLHLQGFDDLEPAGRKIMKKHENRWMRTLEREFRLRDLGRASKLRA